MAWVAIALSIWLVLLAGIVLVWRRSLLALWREPVFTAPILIVESDDWGAGPKAQAAALATLAEHLQQHRDVSGRPAVMTLAVILALPEAGATSPRQQTTLASEAMQPILAAIQAGREQGVFALQLHGMTHYWPETLFAAARSQSEVAAWLAAPDLTEPLPSPLQSRWTDAAVLPSRPHSPAAIAEAVAEEIALYRLVFGTTPEVVVPPTFVWNQRVEAAWAAAGVQAVVTPGRRLTGRDAEGRPAGVDRTMRNSEQGEGGVTYLVRDDYFEPLFGHRPDQAVAALRRKTELGRPCLLETHRSNFLTAAGGDPDAALVALDTLYTTALAEFPTLRFASCAELGQAMRNADPAWIAQDGRRRFTIWRRRAGELPRFGKAARLSGLSAVLQLFDQLIRSDRRP